MRLGGLNVFPVLITLLGVACMRADVDPPDVNRAESALLPTRGRFLDRLFVTGSVEAVDAAFIVTPRVGRGDLQIRWMEEDGVEVREGQTVVEFANEAFVGDLEEKRLSARKLEKELIQLEARAGAEIAEKAFALEQRRAELEKARIEAEVPREILPLREYQERQLSLERAETAFENSREELETLRANKGQEVAIQKLALGKMEFEIRVAENAIQALSLTAPRDGLLLTREIPWEGRKILVGDAVWPGLVLMTIPDLSRMQVVARLSDVDDGVVALGMKARVTLDSFPDRDYGAIVEDITPVAQATSSQSTIRAFRVRLALEQTDVERMRPGMSARVEIVREQRDDALMVPRSTLDFTASPPLIAFEDGRTAPIKLGSCNAFSCIVEEGINETTRLSAGSIP